MKRECNNFEGVKILPLKLRPSAGWPLTEERAFYFNPSVARTAIMDEVGEEQKTQEQSEDRQGLTEELPSHSDENADINPKTEHWKESPFAVGLVDVTWEESKQCCICRVYSEDNGDSGNSNSKSPVGVRFAGWFCSKAGRVGNMIVLKEGKTKDGQRRLDIVMGPYWPVVTIITFPLVVMVSILTWFRSLHDMHVALQVPWVLLTSGLICSLLLVSCRNPGILRRHSEMPPGEEWIWNDQALTFRPEMAKYDVECAAVIEDFDHTCPWTGTAIGKNNMPAFKMFLKLIFTCAIFDVGLNLFTTSSSIST